MNYRVAIYCPDQHLVYEGRTPDEGGVGGGVTARIRLAQALARLGHEVRVIANVPRFHTHLGVSYQPLNHAKQIYTDVLILNSTGGALDLRPVLALQVQCRLKEIWVGGDIPVQGVNEASYDYIVAPSNFIRLAIRSDWGAPADRLFVAYNGVQRCRRRFSLLPARHRDPFRLTYCSHPSKGLGSALGILRRLRLEDKRFELHVYGGNRLWGGEEQFLEPEAGLFYHGLIGQRRLAKELERSGFALNLQGRREPFGMVVTEAMAAGAIVLASPVGAYPEIIRDGYDGFLVTGDYAGDEAQTKAAHLILELNRRPDFSGYIRRNAMAAPLSWETIACAWQGHWNWAFERMANPNSPTHGVGWGKCLECKGALLALADGFHCTDCGWYGRSLQGS